MEAASPGETFVPKVPAARVVDIAKALIEDRDIKTVITGIRPGEKIHEIMVSDEEAWHTFSRGDYYTIKPMLPELWSRTTDEQPLPKEYSSGDSLMTPEETVTLLKKHNLMVDHEIAEEGEFLR